MNSPISTITTQDLGNAPGIVEQVNHWISLLGLETILFRDNREGSYIIMIPMKDAPDLFLEFDIYGREMIYYTNVLTDHTPDDPQEPFYNFLIDILNEQTRYPQIRLSLDKQEKIIVKLHMRYRTSCTVLTMEFLTQLIRESESFLTDIQKYQEKYALRETWRITEGEPKPPPRSINRHDYF
ncbi:MAG: hypothetical protein ACFFD1_08010 [Candidatus Thorarchaeota archaeon]